MRLRQTLVRGWNYMERRARLRNTGIVASLDMPGPGDSCVHVVEVTGWARGHAGEPASVRIAVGGRVVREMPADRPRPDLKPFYPNIPGIENAGFRTSISMSDLPPGRMLWMKATVTLNGAGPDKAVTLRSFPFFRGNAFTKPMPRHAYGHVWDASASSVSNAMAAVAGTSDDGAWRETGQTSANFIAERTGIGPSDVVLEIGCGVARIGTHLADRCKEWIGCDVSQNMLTYAAEAVKGKKNVRFVHLNGYDLSGVPDSSVDVVYCSAVFMHLEEWDRYRYVREAFRVLRPGGRVYYDNFNLLSEEGWALFDDMGRLDVAQRPPNVSKSSTPEELRCYAERAGYEDIAVRADGSIWVGVGARKPQTERPSR